MSPLPAFPRARLLLDAVCQWWLLDQRHWPHRWEHAVRNARAGVPCRCRRCTRARLRWPGVDRTQIDRDRLFWESA